MIDVEPMIRSELNHLIPLPPELQPNWDDVWARTRSRQPPRSPKRRTRLSLVAATLLVAAVVATATPVGSAVLRTAGDFSSWLTGLPGTVAPSSDRGALDRSSRLWLAFPSGVTLHRLLRSHVDGATFVLDGYRVGDSLCLQLVVTGAARGSTQSCVPLSEVKKQAGPAMVVLSDSPFGLLRSPPVRLGPDTLVNAPRAAVTIGIVADGVKKVDVAGNSNRLQHALVGSDAFMAIVDRPQVGYRTKRIWVISDGKRVAIGFAPSPFERLGQSAQNRAALGPDHVDRIETGGQIAWLQHREPRGRRVPPLAQGISHSPFFDRPLFERVIAPDPRSLLREVVSIERLKISAQSPPQTDVCYTLLAGPTGGAGCDPLDQLFTHGPINASQSVGASGDQFETIDGVASDDVKDVEVFLASGEQIAVPLADNTFIVRVDRTKFPARLVAYDAKHEVIGVETYYTDVLSTAGGNGPAPGAEWRALIRVTSPTGVVATILDAPRSGGGLCWAFRYGNGGGSDSCHAAIWRGPALQISFAPVPIGLRARLGSSFVKGRVAPGVASVVVRFRNGRALKLKAVEGFVLAPLPPRDTLADLEGSYATGYDRGGHQVARVSLP